MPLKKVAAKDGCFVRRTMLSSEPFPAVNFAGEVIRTLAFPDKPSDLERGKLGHYHFQGILFMLHAGTAEVNIAVVVGFSRWIFGIFVLFPFNWPSKTS
jgi:hypothetical protein